MQAISLFSGRPVTPTSAFANSIAYRLLLVIGLYDVWRATRTRYLVTWSIVLHTHVISAMTRSSVLSEIKWRVFTNNYLCSIH